MILVTTGTHPQQFNRLVEAIDELIKNQVLKEKTIIQIGYSTYIPKNAKWFRFVTYLNMMKLLKKSSVVITHGGIGSVLLSVSLNKPTIVIPRLKEFNEHTNDHQLEIVEELHKQNKIIPVYDIASLDVAIEKSRSFKPSKSQKNKKIIHTINNFLTRLEEIQL